MPDPVAGRSATLVLIFLLEYPFSGTVAVTPTPFERVVEDLRPAGAASTSQSGFSGTALYAGLRDKSS